MESDKAVVYVCGMCNGDFKIGMCRDIKNLKNRMRQLSSKTKNNIMPIRYWIDDRAVDLEYLLHMRFSDKRTCGEWFSLSPDEINLIMNSPDGWDIVKDTPRENIIIHSEWNGRNKPGYDR